MFHKHRHLFFLDVGQGDASVYMDKDCVVVIDAFGKVQRYLNSHGRNQIDYLFVTHSDIDHMKEVENLVDNMDIEYIITSPYQPLPNIVSSTIYDFPHQIVCGGDQQLGYLDLGPLCLMTMMIL